MTIHSLCICTKTGKLLVSRSFYPYSKLQLEELILTFPKLIDSTQQHTFTETSTQRFLYLPLNNLYLLIISSKNSNIIENMEIIRLFSSCIQDQLEGEIDEEKVLKKAWEILEIMNEIVNDGWREKINLEKLKEFNTMNSVEENLDKALKIAKEAEAKEQAKKYLREKQNKSIPDQQEQFKETIIKKIEFVKEKEIPLEPSKFLKKSGIVLGKKKNITIPIVQIQQIPEVIEQPKYNPLNKSIEILVKEQVYCTLTREYDLQQFEILGELQLKFHDQQKLNCQIQISNFDKSLNIKPHPQLNRQSWADNNIIQSKTDLFPYNQNISALKYKIIYNNVSQLPFTFTYWFNQRSLTFEIEFNQNSILQYLQNLCLIVNIPCAYSVDSCENSQYEQKNNLKWIIEDLSKNNQVVSIALNLKEDISLEDIFPLQVNFQQEKVISNLNILSAKNGDEDVSFSVKQILETTSFQIV